MSMRYHSNHEHTVKASELTRLLPMDQRLAYIELLEAGDWKGAGDLLGENLPKEFPCPELFQMQPAYHKSEDLEIDEIYATWNREDLFVIQERPELKALKANGIDPQLSNWVSWS